MAYFEGNSVLITKKKSEGLGKTPFTLKFENNKVERNYGPSSAQGVAIYVDGG